MKKILFAALFVLAALPVVAQQTHFTVNGTSSKNGAKVVVFNNATRALLGSAVVADGKFVISGDADKNALMSVGEEKGSWMTLFFNDGTPVSVNLDDNTLMGSPVNERLVRYDLACANPNPTAVEKIFMDERNNFIPVAFIEEYAEHFGMERLDSIVNTSPAWTSHPLAKAKLQYIAQEMAIEAQKKAFIGQQFTDLEEADVDGKMHKLSEYVGKGRWVLVDFWASWCGPCRREMPNVVAAYDKYHAKGFDVVGLSFDSKKEAWVKAIEQLKMPWVHLSDLKFWRTVASEVYSVNSIPDNLLIDPQGKIVARGLRAEGLHAKLKEIFGE
ncbi:TlpA disulfide reductase family protein [Xylanibacter ruminicola]|uniref:Peroxiredoxin n=1 Tax=Xylanibacter ruminicola TaxID=839 RepID=A0A1M6Y0B2_XYLRU|nr:TlpA disulfide reductase family protein [Xylanibacter ruminicola]SHL11616.1 Peroxiredoxin [Xylanibacter ruminicola]